MISKITDEQLREELKAGSSNADISKKYSMNIRTIERRRAGLGKSVSYENEINKAPFERALAEAKGNKTKAAELLGISVSSFRRNLEDIDISGFYRKVRKAKTYIITTAQNATPVKDAFWKSFSISGNTSLNSYVLSSLLPTRTSFTVSSK